MKFYIAQDDRLNSIFSMSCRLPAEERRISLQLIADRTQLSLDGVEFLLMKALSLHLIEGSIDQVDGYVQVVQSLEFYFTCDPL